MGKQPCQTGLIPEGARLPHAHAGRRFQIKRRRDSGLPSEGFGPAELSEGFRRVHQKKSGCAGFRPLTKPWFWKAPRFLHPSDARNAHEKCSCIRFWAQPQTPAGAKGSACPVGTWAEGPKRPAARRREASALWAVARSAKRPAGVSKYKGCARPARRTPIFARAAKPCARPSGSARD